MFQIKWMWECLEGKRRLYITAMLLTSAASVMLIINPTLSRMLVDKVIIGVTSADGSVFHNTDILLPLLCAMIGTTILRSCLRYGMILLYENTSQGMIVKLRSRIYEKLNSLDISFYDGMRTGDLMTRLTGDLDMVRHTVAWIVYNIIESVLIFAIAVVYFFSLNITLTLSMLAITPFLFATTYFFSKTVRPYYRDLREKLTSMNSAAQENITANRIVKAFAKEKYETDKFEEKNNDYREANIKAQQRWLKFFPAIETMAQLMNVIVLFIGGFLIMENKLTPGELASFTAMTWCVSTPMRNLGILLNDIQRFLLASNKIIEIYYANPAVKNCADPIAANKMDGGIVFENVSFKYHNGKEALSDINIKISKGQTVALMGPTGSGKTTFINLITRFADVTEGSVKIDGIDVRRWDMKSLRKHIGVATQEVFLFSDTVDSNIAFGNTELSEEEVKKFARISASDFINNLPGGYETIIGERGTGLSGGQKQRIALARALAVKPSILILDDTTSAVDLETEKFIQNELKNLDFECTKIIIAQRISSVRHADMIVILDGGRVIDVGTHSELITKDGYYKDIYELQYSGREEIITEEGVKNGCKE